MEEKGYGGGKKLLWIGRGVLVFLGGRLQHPEPLVVCMCSFPCISTPDCTPSIFSVLRRKFSENFFHFYSMLSVPN